MSDETEIDDLFATEVEVGPSTASNPRLLQVIGALVVVGVVVGAAITVVVAGLSSITVQRGDGVCGGAAACTDLSLDEVRSLTAINLPDGSDVIESAYTATDDHVTVTARVLLPVGADDPFTGTGYGPISMPHLEWPTENLTVLDYFGASGEEGSLRAEAVYAVDDRMREVVLVQITRTFE